MLMISMAMALFVVIFHAYVLAIISKRYARWISDLHPIERLGGSLKAIAVLVTLLIATHVIDNYLLGAFLYLIGAANNLQDGFNLAIENYTTLGSRELSQHNRWRSFGPMAALAGFFTFAWTSAILVRFLNQIYDEGER